MTTKEEGMKRVQSLIKGWMEEIEKLRGWRQLPPDITNSVRHAIFRLAWGAYKIGLLTDKVE